MDQRIGVMGEHDSVIGFRALGLTVCEVTEADAAERTLAQWAEEGYAVVFITESLAEKMGARLTAWRLRYLRVQRGMSGRTGGDFLPRADFYSGSVRCVSFTMHQSIVSHVEQMSPWSHRMQTSVLMHPEINVAPRPSTEFTLIDSNRSIRLRDRLIRIP